ncbi:MAG: ABC transporter ATP-binding protein/permease [Ruminococcus sp.]|jgi:ATP-binding cassette subfamily B protein|nr:ABC transporter ATP-binding protein/permease [Ruminococcus sp.]
MKKIAKRFWSKYKIYFLLGPAAKLFEAVFELLTPLIMADMIDNGLSGGRGYILRGGLIIIAFGVFGLLFTMCCQYMGSKVAANVQNDIEDALFLHINKFEYAEIDRFGAPTLINRLNNDITQVSMATALTIRLVVRAPFLVAGATVMAVSIDPKLGSIFAVLIPLIVGTLWFVTAKTAPRFRFVQNLLDRIAAVTSEQIAGVRVIRAFGKEDFEKERFLKANTEYKTAITKTSAAAALSNPLTYALLNLGIAVILWAGAFRVNTGHLTQGELLAFINYAVQMSVAVSAVAMLVITFTKAMASAERINEILDTDVSVSETDNPIAKLVSENETVLELSGVSFRFDGTSENALDDINFKLKKGEMLGITGITGSGKTALINLLPRFYEAEGVIKLFGCDIKTLKKSVLREKIAVVPQKSALFSGTILDNLRFGNPNLTEEAAKNALEIACIGNIDIGAPVESGGGNFSGGQRQRLAIARAVAASPAILILDDSFSALDRKTEAAIRESLRKKLPETAVICVSQRINSIRDADEIILLDDGKITARGVHENLVKTSAEYADICNSQDIE